MEINRKKAGQLLGISVRTIDRYIRRGKLSARIGESGRIWLDKKEVMDLPRPKIIDNRTTIDTVHRTDDASFYRDLYEETKRILTDYQQKLEQMNYGPVMPIAHQPPQIIERIERKETSLTEREYEKEIHTLREALKQERISRIIFATLTYILLGLLPLIWYLLR